MVPMPAALNPDDYRVTDSLADVREWRARILAGNSMPEDRKVGDMEEVGYVMVRVVGEPLFVPIARSDEHRQGYELMHDRRRKWKIRPEDFEPVFSMGNGVYLWSADQIPRAVEALTRWHAAGGPDVMVCQVGAEPRWKTGSRDFLAGRGEPIPGPDGLLPVGQRCVDRFARLNEAIAAYRDPHEPWRFLDVDALGARGVREVRRRAAELVEFMRSTRDFAFEAFYDPDGSGAKFRGFDDLDGALDDWSRRLAEHADAMDLDAIRTLLFTHDGAKNRIHQAIRKELREDGYSTHMRDFFGDLDMADDAMGRVSPGRTAEECDADVAAYRLAP